MDSSASIVFPLFLFLFSLFLLLHLYFRSPWFRSPPHPPHSHSHHQAHDANHRTNANNSSTANGSHNPPSPPHPSGIHRIKPLAGKKKVLPRAPSKQNKTPSIEAVNDITYQVDVPASAPPVYIAVTTLPSRIHHID